MNRTAPKARGTDARIRVAVLGSTGSIGRSALDVIRRHPDRFEVTVLAANGSVGRLAEQAERHRPDLVVVCDEQAFERCADPGPEWCSGRERMVEAVARSDVDVVVNALVGFAGLEPSLRALEAGKRLALANKESLVAGGPLMARALESGGGQLVPIDSEHSAILQCLAGAPMRSVARVILTASGGPFRGWEAERIAAAGPRDALKHPTWNMGAKITIDSATLANKALEVVEAHFLYDLSYDRIGAVVHPQSIIHSMVEFADGSVMAQMGFPTMELPILYALTFPERVADRALRTFDPTSLPDLTFEEIDRDAFPLFDLGCEAGITGGTAPACFNAANEVAVAAFLEEKIPFHGMAAVVAGALDRMTVSEIESLDDVLAADREARRITEELVLGTSGDNVRT